MMPSKSPMPTASRSWLLWTALAVGLSGCRSCESKPPEPQVVTKKTETHQEDFEARRAKRRAKMGDKKGVHARRESLNTLKMTVPEATEEARAASEAVERAKTLVLQGELGPATEARGLLTTRLAEAPTDADALYWMGRSYHVERIQVPAIEWYQKALEAEPDFVGAHRWLAWTLHAEGRCEEARPHLDAAVTARPEQADVLVDRAVCAVALRDWDAAVPDLTAACALDSFDWCEEVANLVKAEARRKARREKAREMSGKVGKLHKGGKGKVVGRPRFGVGKLGKGKLGKGKAKADAPPPTDAPPPAEEPVPSEE